MVASLRSDCASKEANDNGQESVRVGRTHIKWLCGRAKVFLLNLLRCTWKENNDYEKSHKSKFKPSRIPRGPIFLANKWEGYSVALYASSLKSHYMWPLISSDDSCLKLRSLPLRMLGPSSFFFHSVHFLILIHPRIKCALAKWTLTWRNWAWRRVADLNCVFMKTFVLQRISNYNQFVSHSISSDPNGKLVFRLIKRPHDMTEDMTHTHTVCKV